ncbi:hypothetical protein EDEG_00028 [Edhazardia aedis USNM 41457]|uniref:ABC transporter domain-containing protein n=1 Tax=Edhazardia aedis (strain USNM 41457) TaxID=1003232 RepID=J9D1I0_EDHAE|nr:hypothetical protein EDEG_00028 [Edhazardia aedis USNM 41457]|eukprot:EJW01434.1 hypothetical protein EDEG_00028 [Edhazardia aedis USNM 41457]
MLEWEGLNFEVLNKNKISKSKYYDIIKNCSGKVNKGEMMAIMGLSGSGKTTLLNGIAGRIPSGSKTQGNVTFNGKHRNIHSWLNEIGFVDQDDLVHNSLTVRETLRYSALFRLKKRKTYESEVYEHVNQENFEDSYVINTGKTIDLDTKLKNTEEFVEINESDKINQFSADKNTKHILESSDISEKKSSEHLRDIYLQEIQNEKYILANPVDVKKSNHNDKNNIFHTFLSKFKPTLLLSKIRKIFSDNFVFHNKFEGVDIQEIDKKVEKIIKDLRLTECAQNEMKKISGGERKRVMIGIELISDPQVLFLDEPTSGLDTLTALKIIKILKEQAEMNGKIIILTIHQPTTEIFNQFNHLILLNHGFVLYNGKTNTVEDHFRSLGILKRDLITVPEFIIEICSDEFKEENPNAFYMEECIFKEQPIVKDENLQNTKNKFYMNMAFSAWHTKILLQRKFRIEMNNKLRFLKNLCMKMSMYLTLYLIVLVVYNIATKQPSNFLSKSAALGNIIKMFSDLTKNNEFLISIVMGTLTSIILYFLVFLQVSSAVTSFYHDNKITRREIAVESYSILSYYISLLIYQMLYELICPVICLFLYVLTLPKILSPVFIFMHVLSPFASVPFGICIGSITSIKQIITILSSASASISSISPATIASIIKNYGINPLTNRNNWIGNLSYFAALIPSYHYVTIFSQLSIDTNNLKSKNKALIRAALQNYYSDQMKYIGGQLYSLLQLFLLFIICIIFFTILGTYLLGLQLMPEIRLELEKNRYKKTS